MSKALTAIICDLDGVLCDSTHRQHFLKENPKNWKAFFAAADTDTLIPGPKLLLDQIHRDRTLYLTGRPESMRETTTQWLREFGLWTPLICKLVMRGADDKNADHYLKRKWLEELRQEYDILMAIDSRPEACRMWRDEGIFCVRTSEVDF